MSDQNRVIRFRAWDEKLKVMIFNFAIYSDADHLGIDLDEAMKYYTEDELNDNSGHLSDGENEWLFVMDQFVLMQFTGIQDKNGNDIYEGDVVVWGFTGNGIGEIKWDHKNFKYEISFIKGNVPEGLKDFWSDRIEVIGNRHEHPSLLNPQTT